MKCCALSFFLMVLAGQATALSCLRPDPITTFKNIADAPEPFYILYGQLNFDETLLDDTTDLSLSTDIDQVLARFQGHGLGPAGFTIDYTADVMVQVTCVQSWCGRANGGVNALYFARADVSPAVIVANACGTMIFENPSQAVLDELTVCAQGRACSAQTLK